MYWRLCDKVISCEFPTSIIKMYANFNNALLLFAFFWSLYYTILTMLIKVVCYLCSISALSVTSIPNSLQITIDLNLMLWRREVTLFSPVLRFQNFYTAKIQWMTAVTLGLKVCCCKWKQKTNAATTPRWKAAHITFLMSGLDMLK